MICASEWIGSLHYVGNDEYNYAFTKIQGEEDWA